MSSSEGENNNIGEEFIQNAHFDLDSVPNIPLPINDNLSENHKNLLRALMINQHNLINNCEWLHTRLAEAFEFIEKITSEVFPVDDGELRQINEEQDEAGQAAS